MAQKVLYVLTDDIDQSEAAETVVFGIDSSSYEIDLSAANAQALRDVLAPYVGVARRVGARRGRPADLPAAATASLGLIVRSTAESAARIRQFAQVANATPEALQRWSAGARTEIRSPPCSIRATPRRRVRSHRPRRIKSSTARCASSRMAR